MAQFTKKAIIEAFIELLGERPLDKITVKDIVTRCGVNRNTFYYYYQDIYALVADIFELETQRILGDNMEYDSWQDAFFRATDFALKNKQGIYHIYKSMSREQLENYLNRVTYDSMLRFVKSQAQDISAPEEDVRTIALFYTHALVGMVLQWLNDGMEEDPYRYINEVARLFDGNIRYTLSKNSKTAQKSDK